MNVNQYKYVTYPMQNYTNMQGQPLSEEDLAQVEVHIKAALQYSLQQSLAKEEDDE